jgi:ribonuclease HII
LLLVAQASVEEIDTLIPWATMLAMKRAVEGLRLEARQGAVDGNRLPVLDILAGAVIGGDATVGAISAASILPAASRSPLPDAARGVSAVRLRVPQGYSTPEYLEAPVSTAPAGITAVLRPGRGDVRLETATVSVTVS